MRKHHPFFVLGSTLLVAMLFGCTSAALSTDKSISLPVRLAWFENREVQYVTTDVSDQAVALEQGANFVQGLAAATGAKLTARVYKLANFDQRTVFTSAPKPLGGGNSDRSYSPLWRLVLVTWKQPARAQELRSEEAILAAEAGGEVDLQVTAIVLNCPILSVQGVGALPGVR